jgi:hypothetical protein
MYKSSVGANFFMMLSKSEKAIAVSGCHHHDDVWRAIDRYSSDGFIGTDTTRLQYECDLDSRFYDLLQ